jgi:hypothetical protein
MNWRGHASTNLPNPEQPPAFLEFHLESAHRRPAPVRLLVELQLGGGIIQRVLNLQRHGMDLSPNTMGDAAAKVADQCGLLAGRMKQGMLASRYVRADETFIRYLDRTIPSGSSNGYFWVYRGLTGEVIFDWQTSREHRHASERLGPGYGGILQSAGYQA